MPASSITTRKPQTSRTSSRQAKPKTHTQRKHSERPKFNKEITPRFGREEWRLTVLRRGKPSLSIDEFVEAFDWGEDDNHLMSGSMTLHLPAFGKWQRYMLGPGDVVKCEVGVWGMSNFREIWRMTVYEPQYQIASDLYQWTLVDDLVRLQRSKGHFRYRKDKAHPHGWLPHQIIADIAHRYHFKVSRMPTLHHRVMNLIRTDVSPLEIIGLLMRRERVATGNRYFVRWVNGGIALLPYQRSKELLLLSQTIIDGTYDLQLADTYANVLNVHGKGVLHRDPKDKKKRRGEKQTRLRVTVRNQKGIDSYGPIERSVNAPDYVNTHAELLTYAKHILAKESKPKQDLSFTHPGIPSLRRGHAIKLQIPRAGIINQIAYVKDVKHNVGQSNDYTMDVTLQFDDPFVIAHVERTKQKRCAAAARSRRHPPPGCPLTKRNHGAAEKDRQKHSDAPAQTGKKAGAGSVKLTGAAAEIEKVING